MSRACPHAFGVWGLAGKACVRMKCLHGNIRIISLRISSNLRLRVVKAAQVLQAAKARRNGLLQFFHLLQLISQFNLAALFALS